MNKESQYIIPGPISATLFQRIVVKVNNVEVVNADNYPLITKLLFLTKLSHERRQMFEDVGEYYGFDEGNVSRGPEKKIGGKTMRTWRMMSNRFTDRADRSAALKHEAANGEIF